MAACLAVVVAVVGVGEAEAVGGQQWVCKRSVSACGSRGEVLLLLLQGRSARAGEPLGW